MRSLLPVALIVVVGCSSASSPPAPDFAQKDVNAAVEKRVREELAKRDAEQQRKAVEDAAKKAAAANNAPEPKEKVWTFDEAMQDANRCFSEIKSDDYNELAKRLTQIEAAGISRLIELTPEQWMGLPKDFKVSYSAALRSAGFTNTLLKLKGVGGISSDVFRESAKAVWDQVTAFRDPKEIARAALLVGRDRGQVYHFAKGLFPKNDMSVLIPTQYRDFWEEFSGTTWDKLR